MSIRVAECVAIVLLLVASAACGEASDSSASAQGGGTEEDFAAYARSLFAELRQEPLDLTAQIELGLFGDLSLSTNERVVMRRYRYRVDSAEFGPVAQMTFHVRDSLQQETAIPVVLTFAFRENEWHLERADYGGDPTVVAKGDPDATDPQSPDSQSVDSFDTGAELTPLQRLLRADFHAWIDAAIRRANSSPET